VSLDGSRYERQWLGSALHENYFVFLSRSLVWFRGSYGSGPALIWWTPRKTRNDTVREEVFMATKQKYTREFKLGAVRLVQKGNSASRVAEQLGIRSDMLRHWKQQVETSELTETEVFPGKGRVANAEQEVRRLRRELELVTQERDFLKKAAAYFAKERS
jgi:transposase